MESQPQNPEFKNNPENFHPCILLHLGGNCNQNFHLGRYMVGYTVRNLVFWRHATNGHRKFRPYIR